MWGPATSHLSHGWDRGEKKEAGKLPEVTIIRLINSSPGTVEPRSKQAAGGRAQFIL